MHQCCDSSRHLVVMKVCSKTAHDSGGLLSHWPAHIIHTLAQSRGYRPCKRVMCNWYDRSNSSERSSRGCSSCNAVKGNDEEVQEYVRARSAGICPGLPQHRLHPDQEFGIHVFLMKSETCMRLYLLNIVMASAGVLMPRLPAIRPGRHAPPPLGASYRSWHRTLCQVSQQASEAECSHMSMQKSVVGVQTSVVIILFITKMMDSICRFSSWEDL